MKVVHLCLGCFFPDNYSYQENMLPKFHKELGYDVEVIASLETFDKDGKATYMDKAEVYQNEYDIKVTRLNFKNPTKIYKKMKRYVGTYQAIETAKPDILFIHGCQFQDMDKVVKYIKGHPGVRVYVDHHADFSNSAKNWMSRHVLHGFFWKRTAHMVEPYTTKFYGVLPARVDFLKNIYKLPEEKCELLVMGADDEYVEKYSSPDSCLDLKKKYNLRTNDFVIVTGGKIDSFKRQTLLLMEAVRDINDPHVKLLVFGSIQDDIRAEFDDLCDGTLVQYLGWANAEQAYMYFSLADLVVFPGRHSVYWEQAAGQGKPMICKYWDGTTHVDLGGNVEFLYKDSVEEIRQAIQSLMSADGERTDKYYSMKKCAAEKGPDVFSYKKIAERSIECC